jgi:hypothetical protein
MDHPDLFTLPPQRPLSSLSWELHCCPRLLFPQSWLETICVVGRYRCRSSYEILGRGPTMIRALLPCFTWPKGDPPRPLEVGSSSTSRRHAVAKAINVLHHGTSGRPRPKWCVLGDDDVGQCWEDNINVVEKESMAFLLYISWSFM